MSETTAIKRRSIGIVSTIGRSYEFQAAHLLPRVPPEHKCGRLHGHTYKLHVRVCGRTEPTLGWLMDFAMLDAMVKTQILAHLDHRHLNEVDGLANPTSENIAWWVWQRLEICAWPDGVSLDGVTVEENDHSFASVEADLDPVER